MTDKRVTQVAAEQWVQGPSPSGRVTQAAVEHWSTVAWLNPGAAQMDGTASVAAAGGLIRFAAGQMDGAASMAATGSIFIVGAGQMDGQGSLDGSTIAVTTAAAHMDGQGSLDVTGGSIVIATGQMDGQASLIAAWPIGSAMGEMGGQGSLDAVSLYVGPTVHQEFLTSTILGTQARPVAKLTYNISMLQNARITLLKSLRFDLMRCWLKTSS